MKKITVYSLIAMLAAFAASSAAFGEVPGIVNNVNPVVRKLGRGLANTLGGILEVPLTMQQVAIERGPVAGLTLGVLVGLGRAVARTTLGIFETVTFPFPLNEGYEPLFYPEFVLEPAAAPSPAVK